MWASDMPDGSPGVAVWDLYAAEDADKVRLAFFLAVHRRYESSPGRADSLSPAHTCARASADAAPLPPPLPPALALQIRDFLYGHIAKLEGWKDADEARKRVDECVSSSSRSSPFALSASH